jgi:hypothetical protein
MWNVRSLHRVHSLTAAATEYAQHKLVLKGMQEIRWDKGGIVCAQDYKFLMEREMKIITWEQDFLYTTN